MKVPKNQRSNEPIKNATQEYKLQTLGNIRNTTMRNIANRGKYESVCFKNANVIEEKY